MVDPNISTKGEKNCAIHFFSRLQNTSTKKPFKSGTYQKLLYLPSGDMATPCGFVNSPLLRPLLPTLRTRSSSIGLFLEQAESTKDLKRSQLNRGGE